MPDPTLPDRGDQALAAALRALPLADPGDQAWPRLARQLRARRRPLPALRRWWPLAAAAALALVLLPWATTPPDGEPGTGRGDLEAGLIAQSQWLEGLLATPALSPPERDGDVALLELGLQARLGGIDAALADAGPAPAPALWQARVDTLAQLAAVRLGTAPGGAGGSVADHRPVATTLLWAN
ncbi:MAG: hypothetical protein U0S76_05500 [Pseudoxanthomonas sp.]|nr:hypothetical protein [Pseudoxanthomonas sp.]